jgi:succinate dehydrogenase/fumarate reductase cytochrome b subunit
MRPVATTWEREWARALHGITDYRPPPPARLSSLARTAGVFFLFLFSYFLFLGAKNTFKMANNMYSLFGFLLAKFF